MTFWEHFFRLLRRKPRPALLALYWHLTRRRVRARNVLNVASVDLPFAYAVWLITNEQSSNHRDVRTLLSQLNKHIAFSVLIHSAKPFSNAQHEQTVKSVESQLYPASALVDCTPRSIESGNLGAEADFVVPLRVGDVLSEHALLRFAEALQENPSAKILYGDEDRIDERGNRMRPWFKPRWNSEMFLAQDFLGAAVAMESKLARKAAENCGGRLSDLVLAATAIAGDAITHVPYILTHVGQGSVDDDNRLEAVANLLKPKGANCSAGSFGTVRVQWPLPQDLPAVSIIVPTKDKLELLRPCVDSVLTNTDYPNFELLIVDNGSLERRTMQFFEELADVPNVRVLDYPQPYNFSAINNFASQRANGTFLCLLNNDTEVLEPTWLTEMMRYAVRPEVGAAGAKLLYEDRTIQHAGVVVGIGEAAGHAHRFLPADEPGYFRMAHVAQFVSAVTAACLVVEKKKFESVGGLDADGLAIAFNDVDLCLKLEAAGWRNVYVPHAILMHHESRSRGNDMAPDQIDRYHRELAVLQNRWGTKTYQDPLHNPNLDRYSETFVFRI